MADPGGLGKPTTALLVAVAVESSLLQAKLRESPLAHQLTPTRIMQNRHACNRFERPLVG